LWKTPKLIITGAVVERKIKTIWVKFSSVRQEIRQWRALPVISDEISQKILPPKQS